MDKAMGKLVAELVGGRGGAVGVGVGVRVAADSKGAQIILQKSQISA